MSTPNSLVNATLVAMAMTASALFGAVGGEENGACMSETKKWFLDNVYGHAPVGRPADMSFCGNTILFAGGKVKINLTIAMPKGASPEKPCPVLLMGDFRTWNNGMRDDEN